MTPREYPSGCFVVYFLQLTRIPSAFMFQLLGVKWLAKRAANYLGFQKDRAPKVRKPRFRFEKVRQASRPKESVSGSGGQQAGWAHRVGGALRGQTPHFFRCPCGEMCAWSVLAFCGFAARPVRVHVDALPRQDLRILRGASHVQLEA